MRTTAEARGRGWATLMLRHILNDARARNLERVLLETGSEDYFAPARRPYAHHGFTECPPFADYVLRMAASLASAGLSRMLRPTPFIWEAMESRRQPECSGRRYWSGTPGTAPHFRRALDGHERLLLAGHPIPRVPGKIPRANYLTLLGLTPDEDDLKPVTDADGSTSGN